MRAQRRRLLARAAVRFDLPFNRKASIGISDPAPGKYNASAASSDAFSHSLGQLLPIAGASANGEDAPIPAARWATIER